MWTFTLSLIVNIILVGTLLAVLVYPRFIERYRKRKNLKKAREVKALREEVRRYLDEIRNN